MKQTLVNLLVVLLAWFSVDRLSAQVDLNITGKVTGIDGNGIAGVTVALKGQKRSTVTAADGSYTLDANSIGVKTPPSAPVSGLSFQNRLLDFNVPEGGAWVQIRIFNLMGQPEATLVNGQLSHGHHRIDPFVSARKSQLGFLNIKIGNQEHTLKMFSSGIQGPQISTVDARPAFHSAAMKAAAASAYDTLLVNKTGYTPDYKRINSFTGSYDFFLAKPEVFWGDPATAPVATQVMTYVFLNRTNGKYADNQIFWTFSGKDLNNVVLPEINGNLAQNPTFDVPLHKSGRVTFHLGTVNGNYSDFVEETVDTYGWHGNTTRVDAYGLPMAMRLLCGDGKDLLLGEKYQVFYMGRDKFFAKYKASVPLEFQPTIDSGSGIRIVAPGKGEKAFGSNDKYANYLNAYFTQLGLSGNGATTQEAFSCSGDIFGQNAPLCGAVNRHVAHLAKTQWTNPENFYQQAPANYYAKFIHENSFQEKAYGFAYDDAAEMAAYSECAKPKTLIIAIGF